MEIWYAWKASNRTPWSLYHTLNMEIGGKTKCGSPVIGKTHIISFLPKEEHRCKRCYLLTEITDDSICIEDFNGKFVFPTAWWCDWKEGIVSFGGEWEEVPDMPYPNKPDTFGKLITARDKCYGWVEEKTGRKYPHTKGA